ncbi:MAG TPA: L-serine ammonia-lyase [Ignavibacteriaceae bacterium]|jgi:L-serine dehydratase|nr:MAG: L-serine dehydratase 1 [Ignavibacteria bacterium ADurb.Bin266]OQY70064.1 MAG: L-serine ammonia-lyase [Ignavibacteriales bacterium UTCHB2]HQF41282.1 L-serine ammonia-lyase [Ignavibacteriaceae bacterium]HQI40517.1 L-serine ammonia-lyase [Ignavibacteriaceae bacterium]HQJ45078.1 L-serine ammonia-lyase [Ignavibacteriaceae bacterium]
MESIKEIFRIGNGPSSSHTMGPRKAAEIFKSKFNDAVSYSATLYGSLAATGKGHLTDVALVKAFEPKEVKIIWEPETFLPKHPNGLKLEAFDSDKKVIGNWTVYSVGGGKITDFESDESENKLYDLTMMSDILAWTKKTGKSFWEYVVSVEGTEIYDYLQEVWSVMTNSIKRGIENEGILPGGLGLARKASSYFVKAKNYSGSLKGKTLIFSYALAVAEENASGGLISTAPTCGSCGVVPAVLKYLQESFSFSDDKILRALATAGLFGNIVKKNASISGAKVGCQGEIGTACSMASAAATQLLGGTPNQIEYAAEMGIEHHLGLTCDPINGLVQVPCIERNAFAAERALNTSTFALLSDGRHLVSFDKIVKTMNQTGHDLPSIYKETSEGGMALLDI